MVVAFFEEVEGGAEGGYLIVRVDVALEEDFVLAAVYENSIAFFSK
jgi:hypothetical protein